MIAPIVALLRAGRLVVFVDLDSIRPGARWRAAIDEAISGSDILVVVWCIHSRGSIEVASEYRLALSMGKDVIPLLIDDTPLPVELAAYQCIDLRAMIGDHVIAPGCKSRVLSPAKALGFAVAVAVAVAALQWPLGDRSLIDLLLSVLVASVLVSAISRSIVPAAKCGLLRRRSDCSDVPLIAEKIAAEVVRRHETRSGR